VDSIVVDQELRRRLGGLDRQVTFVDEGGCPLGVFVPMHDYRRYLAGIEIPFTPQEIERRRAESGGCSLQELWSRLERE
jgi:hypothetical protein